MPSTIQLYPLPSTALLAIYQHAGGYTDCYATEIPTVVTFEQYASAFYTTWVFKLERFILKWAVNKPSTDEQARALANGSINAFAAWTVEKRAPNQLLMCDFMGRTRSWLMVEPLDGGKGTRLYFGSAVVAKKKTEKNWIPAFAGMTTKNEKPSMGFLFHALLGFHKLYSRILLGAAKKRLENH